MSKLPGMCYGAELAAFCMVDVDRSSAAPYSVRLLCYERNLHYIASHSDHGSHLQTDSA